ncbi:PRKCSH domain-containing protein [Mycena indigotica]|uniref:Protein OS-9 homolog n=1 Tax=Mycena indigotica TaxID=2126181 RepID=A0A8H6S8L8_9AGAR|nr:PRKCSH domain-containing protein [Mycena indigotica]KAF7295010.1 PRKCSH domain-containing protein [Mycena indigotica]
MSNPTHLYHPHQSRHAHQRHQHPCRGEVLYRRWSVLTTVTSLRDTCGLALLMLLLLLLPFVHARLHSLPEDPYGFPKYKVDFLSNLPVPNDTARRWLAVGLRGGINEFLQDLPLHPPSLGDPDAQIPLGDNLVSLPSQPADDDNEYICLIPKPLDLPAPVDAEEEVPPAQSWSLLNPLTCLYHRTVWFTYSYCHNQEIRQFREIIKVPSLTSGPHQPEEDPNWEAYTLGRAPSAGTDLSVTQKTAAANLELARSANSRYLVQRWGDGTPCDKTGKPREVEVQFHCSMTTTDTIAFVKEAKTCSYVLVVHTPRLCGEPGFMSHKDVTDQALIGCREIVAEKPPKAMLPPAVAADHPEWNPHRKPVLPQQQQQQQQASAKEGGVADKYSEVIRKTLEAIRGMQNGNLEMEMLEDGEGNFVVEIVDDVPMDVDQAIQNKKQAKKDKEDKEERRLREEVDRL